MVLLLGINPIVSGHVNQSPTKSPSTTKDAPQLIYPLKETKLKELLRITVPKLMHKLYPSKDITCYSRAMHVSSKPKIDMSHAHNQLIISQLYQYCVSNIFHRPASRRLGNPLR